VPAAVPAVALAAAPPAAGQSSGVVLPPLLLPASPASLPLTPGSQAREGEGPTLMPSSRSLGGSPLETTSRRLRLRSTSSSNFLGNSGRSLLSLDDDGGSGRRPLSHCGAVALFAMDMLQEISRIRLETGVAVELRIGLHSGKVVGGIIGKSRPRYFLWGQDTVVANLMESSGIAGQIQVSEATAAQLRPEGFMLDRHQAVPLGSVATHPPSPAHAGAPAGESSHAATMQTYLLRGYEAPDGSIISVPEPPRRSIAL